MKLSEMREVLDRRGIQLTKSLGQNFLHDANQLRRIVEAAELSKKDKVLEIGPGLGPLTELLLEKAGEVLAIEKDARLVEFLRERFKVGQASRLSSERVSATENVPRADAAGATPVLHLLARRRAGISQARAARLERLEARRESAVFRRLADFGGTRLRQPRAETHRRHAATRSRAAADGAGGRRRLRHFDPARATGFRAAEHWFKIPADCFFPAPDVDSACVVLERRAQPLLPENLRASFCENREARAFPSGAR